jgi:hypothetical protein
VDPGKALISEAKAGIDRITSPARAIYALQSIRQGFQSLFADRLAAGHAFAVGPLCNALQGGMDLLRLDARRILHAFEHLVALRFGRLLLEIGTGRRAQIAFDFVDSLIQVLETSRILPSFLHVTASAEKLSVRPGFKPLPRTTLTPVGPSHPLE